jgi:hypothetical protein
MLPLIIIAMQQFKWKKVLMELMQELTMRIGEIILPNGSFNMRK